MRKFGWFFLLMLFAGCQKRVILPPAGPGAPVVNDRIHDALSAPLGEVEMIVKSDLPAEEKTKIIETILARRIEALKEILLRESDKGKNWIAAWKEIMLIGAALLGVSQ